MRPHVVTISASLGAGGSVVARRVAERLGVTFVDRAIPMSVARDLGMSLDEALEFDERRPPLLTRFIAAMAAVGSGFGPVPPLGADAFANEEAFRLQTEAAIRQAVADSGGVVLGRGGAIVLARHPSALHVRLDGPRSSRVTRVAVNEGIDEASASRLLDQSDRAREAFVRSFYRTDPRDGRLYHLMIDSTALPLDVCTDLIVLAARAEITPVPPSS